MDKETEIHKEVRKILEKVSKEGKYDSDQFMYLFNLYRKGRGDVQSEIWHVLGIPTSIDDLL